MVKQKWAWMITALVLGLTYMVEIGLMTYLWYNADTTAVRDSIKQYLMTCFQLAVVVNIQEWWFLVLTMWELLMLDSGDEATRLAVDAFVALVTGKDMATFQHRAHVWVWWVKVSIQYVLVYIVLRYWPSKVQDVELQEVVVDRELEQDVVGRVLGRDLEEGVVGRDLEEDEVGRVVVRDLLEDVVSRVVGRDLDAVQDANNRILKW